MAWILSQDKMMAMDTDVLRVSKIFELVASPVGAGWVLGRFSTKERALAVIKDFLGHLDNPDHPPGPGAYRIPSDDDAMLLC